MVKWIFKDNSNENGVTLRNKTRLIEQAHTQLRCQKVNIIGGKMDIQR